MEFQLLDGTPPVACEEVGNDTRFRRNTTQRLFECRAAFLQILNRQFERPNSQQQVCFGLRQQIGSFADHGDPQRSQFLIRQIAEKIVLDAGNAAVGERGGVAALLGREASECRYAKDLGFRLDLKRLLQRFPQKLDSDFEITRFEVVDLVENEEQARDLWTDSPEIGELGFSDRRIDGDNKECSIALGKDLERGIGVVAMRRADARCIDQNNAILQNWCRKEQIDASHVEPVFWIGFLCDKLKEAGANVLGRGIIEFICGTICPIRHSRERLRSPRDEGRNGGERYDTRRQKRLTKKGIEEGALAPFELTQHRELKPLLVEPLAQIVEAYDDWCVRRRGMVKTA